MLPHYIALSGLNDFYRLVLERLRQWVRAFVLALVAIAMVMTSTPTPAWATTQDLGGGTPQSVPTVVQGGVLLPDWSRINFNNLPNFSEAGSFQVPSEVVQQLGFDPSASWQAGTPVVDALRTGVIQDMGVGSLSLDNIDQIIGNLSNALPLGQFQIAQFQTIRSLVDVVPNLESLTAGQVPPINQLVVQNLGSIVTDGVNSIPVANVPIGQLIETFPEIEGLSLSELDLSQFQIGQIPNLSSVPIQDLQNWQSSTLSGVPGLGQIPLNQFPTPLSEGADPFVARVDVPLDSAEQDRERSISGSFQEGFRVSCTENCTHAEMTPIQGSQMDGTHQGAFANGKAWISGRAQQVRGGYGVLSALNGGMEPTGRNPYGGIFKQVIWNVDQAAGKVETTMWFRFCKHGIPDLGCSPYILGPVPFITYPEEMFIYLGIANPSDDGRGVEFANHSDPLSAGDGFNSCGGKLSGAAVNIAISTVDRVSRVMGSRDGAFSTSSSRAQQHIPGILAALREQGITCPAQVAYVLATVHRETSFVNFEEGSTRHQSARGTQFWGRGYVQITHRDAYERIGRAIGVDLVNNPDAAKQPDVAARILAYGFKNGSFGIRRPIDEMIPCEGQVNYREARRMINDSAQSGNIAQAAQIYYEALTGASEGLSETTLEDGGCEEEGNIGGDAPAGSLNERVVQSISRNRGFRTSGIPGTNGGRSACAAAVNNVLYEAGIAPLGGSSRYGSLSVDGVETALRNGRGTRIDPSQAQPGDIVIVRDSATRRHVGFCTSAGCQSQTSNSSSNGSFSWNSRGRPPFRPSYRGNSVAVYRLRS